MTRRDWMEALAMLPVAVLLVAAFYYVSPFVWAMFLVKP